MGKNARLRQGLRRIFPAGITRRTFRSVIGFGMVFLIAITVVLTLISSQYLSQNLQEQLESQAQQVINTFDQEMGTLSSTVLSASSQSSISAWMGGNYSGYQAYTVSRDTYNYICTASNMDPYLEMYLFLPSQDYVLGSLYPNVSSQFDLEAEATTAGWYRDLKDSYATVNIRSDFVPPVSGGDSCFAYIMTVYALSSWEVKGYIAATLDKSFLDNLLEGTLMDGQGFLVVLAPSGEVAYSSNQELLEQNQDLLPTQEELEEGTGPVASGGMGDYYRVAGTSQYGELQFLFFADQSLLNASVSRLLVAVVLVLFLSLLLVLAGAYAVAQSTTRPIREMTKFIHQLEGNGFQGKLTLTARDEVGELITSFNSMVDSVRENQILRSQAQFDALQKQIDPHFLFNTLEIIKALVIRQDTKAACAALGSLGEIFRYNTNRENYSVTALKNELQNVRNYLSIQKLRFGERLHYEICAAENLLQCQTLKFILQPIVENSIRYAMDVMERPYLLRITIQEKGPDKVLIQVADNGPGMPPERLERLQLFLEDQGEQGEFGIGMKNIAQRLRLSYDQPFGLTVESTPGEGTTVRILIPKRQA